MAIIWTSTKPDSNRMRNGYSYFVEYEDKSRMYCNRIFPSIRRAIDSITQNTNAERIKNGAQAKIYDMVTGKEVKALSLITFTDTETKND